MAFCSFLSFLLQFLPDLPAVTSSSLGHMQILHILLPWLVSGCFMLFSKVCPEVKSLCKTQVLLTSRLQANKQQIPSEKDEEPQLFLISSPSNDIMSTYLLEILGLNQHRILALLPYSTLVLYLLLNNLIPCLPTKIPLLESFSSIASCQDLFALYYTTLVQTFLGVGICWALAKLCFCTTSIIGKLCK